MRISRAIAAAMVAVAVVAGLSGCTVSSEKMRYPTAVRERVVRCRDCSSYRPGGNRHKPRCEKSIGTFVPNPNGFCAWGERRGER